MYSCGRTFYYIIIGFRLKRVHLPHHLQKNVFCVIRSPHKYKDSRAHFEMRTHKRLIDIVDPTPKAVDSLMRLDLPADVNIEIKL